MGGSVVLNFAIRYPQLCRTIVVVGAGSGTTNRAQFERDIDHTVDLLRTRGIEGFAEVYGRDQPVCRSSAKTRTAMRSFGANWPTTLPPARR